MRATKSFTGHFLPRKYFGKRSLRRCATSAKGENIVLIEVDSDDFGDVIILDVPESLQEKFRKNEEHHVISIDDDDNASDSRAGKCDMADGATTSNRFSSASAVRRSNSADVNEAGPFVGEGSKPVKLSKSRRTYSGKGISRNQYGLRPDSESCSSESDDSDCELMEDSFGKLREEWMKASFRRRHDANVHSDTEDKAGPSASNIPVHNSDEDAAEHLKPTSNLTNLSSLNHDSDSQKFAEGNGFSQQDSDAKEMDRLSTRKLDHQHGSSDLENNARTCESDQPFQDSTRCSTAEPSELPQDSCCFTNSSFNHERRGIFSDFAKKLAEQSKGSQQEGEAEEMTKIFPGNYSDDNTEGTTNEDIDSDPIAFDDSELTAAGPARAPNNSSVSHHTELKSSSDHNDIITDRQKIKETDEYKRAMEEEWASRQQQLLRQAEEARRLRDKKRAESKRIMDNERRQRLRLEEIRETRRKVSRLMDLIVHSLYSHKEVFLRELVSNASDALDKLRFLSVTEPSLLGDAGDLEIRIKPDPDNGTVTITDSGIGMTKDELIDCLGTIAPSGTSKFLKALKENKDLGADNLIGQFGVGFYSAFLVAETVVVSTKSPRSDKQFVWEAVADSSSYVIREETDPEKLLKRGTQITLYLRSDDKYEFSDPTRIQNLVKNYSQFVSFPIYTWQEKSRTVEVEEEEQPPKEGEKKPEGKKKKTVTEKYWDWELANETKPIWMRNSKDVQKEEYHEFYKKAFNEFLDPLTYTHFTTEGEVEFRSMLFIPGMAPLNNEDVVNPKTKNIRLYVKRVFISDDFDGELFPRYLSFVKGVVDSDDLPLNVSREILQESRIVRIMRKRLVRKTFDMIQELSEGENKEDYKKFWENFGRFLKLGCIEDTGNHKRITPLLRFYSSKSNEDLISLDDYVENMGENQKAIYYLATDSLESAKTAPFLEKLLQKDIEVLYLIEPIDEVAIQNLQTYKEKKFVDISKEDLELGDEDEVKERETKQEYNLLCDWIKQQLGDKVSKVQVSKRLASSPCVLVSGKFGWSANMERLMKAQTLGDTASLEFMRGRRILEINPDHPIVKDLNAACKNAPDSTDAKRAVDLLYETALISSGFTPDSPAELGNKIYEMMAMALGGRWGRLDDGADSSSDLTPVSDDTVEAEVVEASEVRTESDPWQD